jgi:hypothetical protein
VLASAAPPTSIAAWLLVLLSRTGEPAPISAWCVRLRAAWLLALTFAMFFALSCVPICAMFVWLSSSSRFPAAPETFLLRLHR